MSDKRESVRDRRKININAGTMFVTVVKTDGRNEVNPYLLV